ncbi:hypothetical protein VNO78_08684 [Psophocarpus tetragonolobus]|uniref:Mediator of RNA polymerase II transcription subunit 32 n=1 Tax=Psophocarpus tetragonolobus TaxID=3891 RepID=A0AAN9SV90_PSOTE
MLCFVRIMVLFGASKEQRKKKQQIYFTVATIEFHHPLVTQVKRFHPTLNAADQSGADTMDSVVDSLNNAYQDFVAAAANVLESKENAGSIKTTATDTALENFKQKWELFRVACDQAEEFVESVKQRIGSECLVDEATRPVAGKPGQTTMTGLPPISAVRLEQMSKAVRWLVIELQHGSGAGSANNSALSHPSAPFDARFSEDAAQ